MPTILNIELMDKEASPSKECLGMVTYLTLMNVKMLRLLRVEECKHQQ